MSMEIITLSDLIESKRNVSEKEMVEVPSLGKAFEVCRFPLSRIFEMMDSYGATSGSLSENLRFNAALIYASCPIFKSPELQEAWKPKHPEDVVLMFFDAHAEALGELASGIIGIYGIGNDEVKN